MDGDMDPTMMSEMVHGANEKAWRAELRAEAAEAALVSLRGRVEGLAEEWADRRRSDRMSGSAIIGLTLESAAADLRAVLAAAPTPPGEDARWCVCGHAESAHLDKTSACQEESEDWSGARCDCQRFGEMAFTRQIREAEAERPTPPAAPQAEGARAKVITLCGSTRFKSDFESWNSRLTLDGNVVISVGVFGHGMHPYHREKYLDPKKPMLDRLHLQKIDMADEVFIIDPGGYIGDSTRAEIAYAESLGKPVRRLSVIDPECTVCGRDNRNGTHSAMERTGHLSHAFTTEPPAPAPQVEGGEGA